MFARVALAGLAAAGLSRRRAVCWSASHRFERARNFMRSNGVERAPIVTLPALNPGRVSVVTSVHGYKFASVARSAVAWFENRKPSVYAKIVLTSSELYTSAESLVKSWVGLSHSSVPWSADTTPSFVATLDPGICAVIFIHDQEGLTTSQMRHELNDMCRSAAEKNCELSFVIVEAM